MNEMDIDQHTSPLASSSKRPATSPPAISSADKRVKILLPDAQLSTLSSNMKQKSDRKMWQVIVEEAEVDDSLWWDVLSDILMYLTQELESTNMKGSVIANLTLKRADDILKSFNEDELEQWKVGVRNGVERNDWVDLIAHRTYISDYQIIRSHLIVTAAKLKIPKTPNVTPTFELSHQQEKGTPIEKLPPVHY
jgi:hypothetical protein